MKAATHDTFGEPRDVLNAGEIAKPEPKAGEVLVRMTLSPIHNHDLWTVRGTYGYKPDLPAIGGSEAVGTIEAVGEGVDEGLMGKRVTASGVRGSWSEYFTVPGGSVIPLPDAIEDEAAAQLVAMPFSAISLLDFLNVSEGDWVIQTAANGAVGKILAVLAKSRGVNVVNLVRRAEAAEEISNLENIVVTTEDGWQDKVRAITGEKGAKAAVDSVGGKAAADLISLLGDDGLLVTFGSATGEPVPVASGEVIFKQLTIKGFWGARVIRDMEPEKKAALMKELIGLAASGKLPLDVGGVYALDNIIEAVDAALTPGRNGKIMMKG